MAKVTALASLLALVLTLCTGGADSARILAALPNYLKSHSLFTHPIVRELAVRGHHVTVITPFEDDRAPKENYRRIAADKKSIWDADPTDDEIELLVNSDVPFALECVWRWAGLEWFTETGLNSSAVREFIEQDTERYDLVITELFLQEAFLMFAHKYDAPVVMLSSFGSGHYINEQAGNPLLLGSVPHEFAPFYGHPMSVWQRARNALYTAFDLLGRRYYHLPRQQSLAEKYFGKLPGKLPWLGDVERNVSLILVNTHFSVDSVRPKVPGIVEVGGVHIGEPQKLPKDLQKICDESEDGVILFSLGTILKGHRMPKDKVAILVKVFSELKHTVFWKWDSEQTPTEAGKNIRFVKWLPQSGILNHPKTKLFITHGGLLGIQETIHYGVPILGMPFFGDQHLNVDRAVKQGYGARLRFRDITEATLRGTLDRLLNDSKYGEKAKELSKRFKDVPNTPLDTAVFWIEYVIRNRGAEFMRSPLLDMGWFEYWLLDVVALVVFGSMGVGIAAYCVISVLCRLLLFRKPHKRKVRGKEN